MDGEYVYEAWRGVLRRLGRDLALDLETKAPWRCDCFLLMDLSGIGGGI